MKLRRRQHISQRKNGGGCRLCRNNDIDLIIADSELTPSQINNIETKTDTRVVDRTMLILDILPQGQGRARVNCRWSWHSLNIRFRFCRAEARVCRVSAAESAQEVRARASSRANKRHIRRRIHSLSEELKRLKSDATHPLKA